jgi:hypothetical protein
VSGVEITRGANKIMQSQADHRKRKTDTKRCISALSASGRKYREASEIDVTDLSA